MKKMTTAKKVSSNRLTAKRTRKDLKRRSYIKTLIKSQKKINLLSRQIQKQMHLRAKYAINIPAAASNRSHVL